MHFYPPHQPNCSRNTACVAKGYTSVITADSVMEPFPLRWKLLGSAPLGRDVVTDGVCFQSAANIKCQVLVKPPDYIRLQWWLNPSFESNIISDRNKKEKKNERISDSNFSIPNTIFSKNVWQNNFPGFVYKWAWGTEGTPYHLVKAGCSSISPVAMTLITAEMCFPTSKPVSLPPLWVFVKKHTMVHGDLRLDSYGNCYVLIASGQKGQTFFFFWFDELDDIWGTKQNWTDHFFLHSLTVQTGFYRQYSYR